MSCVSCYEHLSLLLLVLLLFLIFLIKSKTSLLQQDLGNPMDFPGIFLTLPKDRISPPRLMFSGICLLTL